MAAKDEGRSWTANDKGRPLLRASEHFGRSLLFAILTIVFTAGSIFAQSQPGDVAAPPPQKLSDTPAVSESNTVSRNARSAALTRKFLALNDETSRGWIADRAARDRLKRSFDESITSDKTFTVSRSKTQSGTGWQFAFAPYLYMTGISGTIGARGRTAEIDADFSDVLKRLNIGLMGAFEARKGKFVILNDVMWIKLSEERDTPGALFSSFKLGVNMFTWDPEAGYQVYQGERGSVDVLGGFRLMSTETNLNFRTGILPGFDVSERKTWATPIVGVRGIWNFNHAIFASGKFDIGGGLGADFTDQLYLGGGYRLTRRVDLIGGYRYLKTDYDSSTGFLFDTTLNGVLIGAKFRF